MITVAAALVAAAHAYLLPWGTLFLLPSGRESACAISSLRYGPPGMKWEKGSQQEKPVSCEFRQFVVPGPLLPIWAEPAETRSPKLCVPVRAKPPRFAAGAPRMAGRFVRRRAV